jgi:hypothetical protein
MRTKFKSLVSLGMTSFKSFRDGIASHKQGENKSLPSLDAVPESNWVKTPSKTEAGHVYWVID